MKHAFCVAIALLCALTATAQDAKTDFNLDFESTMNGTKLPVSYQEWGKDYLVVTDSTVSHSGKKSVLMQKVKDDASFGCVAQGIPAIYKGNTVAIKGWLKLEGVKDGSAGLFLRIDGAGGVLQFENMLKDNITGTADWKEYAIELALPENAEKIYFGALNSGTGKVWADGLELLINGKDISKAKLKTPKLYAADKDTEFDAGSKIPSINLTPQKTEDLKILGLVWGYLKYYHPEVAAGNYNWDAELFRVMPKLLATNTPQQRDKVLYDWASSKGKFTTGTTKPNKDAKLQPDLAWIEKSGLSNELQSFLVSLKDAKRPDESYYIGFYSGVNNPEFKHEKPYADTDFNDAGYRMLALYRYWNMIQYFFPNRHLIDGDWKDVLTEFVPRFANAKNETDYKVALLEIIGRISDTHANVWGYDNALGTFRGSNFAAAEVTFIEEQALVTNFYDEEKGKKTGLQKGDIITAVNNKPVANFVKEQLKYYPASNYPTKLRDIARGVLRSNDTTITINYTRAGKQLSKTISTYPSNSINIYSSYQKKDTCFKFINPKIAYLYPGTIKNDYLPQILKDIKDTDGLVIDLRCYPSEFIVFSLGNHLGEKNKDFVKFTQGSLKNPGEFTYGDHASVGGKKSYKGKVVVLVNETSQSQAEYTAMAFRATGAVIIGSTTAGADGNVSDIILPGKVRSMISGIGVYYPDGTETQRVGIVPDIEVKPTIKGIQAGRDEVLEKAIELINKKQ